MGLRHGGERQNPSGFWNMYERPLSQEKADHGVRVGAALMGVGMSMFGGVGLLLGFLRDTSDNHKQIIIAIVTLFLLGYALAQYGGLKLGHGHHQGGKLGLQPRTMRRLWAVAEYYTCASAFLTAVGGVFLVAALLLGWTNDEVTNEDVWVLFVFNLFFCLAMFGIWRYVRGRRKRLFPGRAIHS